MSAKEISFPVYRKYVGINVWFKITSQKHFIEIKKVGKKLVSHQIKAVQYPEMVLINDMIDCFENRWEPIENTVFEDLFLKISK